MPDLTAPTHWANLPFFGKPFEAILNKLHEPYLPRPDQIFAALNACAPDDVRVVILGQDPYPTPGHAMGLSFSVTRGVTPLPRSLSNIFKEMRADIGAAPSHGDLRFWANQGVLLLNTVLTVPPGQANGHQHLGWQTLTDQVLARLDDRPRALILWGAKAQHSARHMRHPDHLRITSAHPSPLSAYRGFFGSRPFSRVNDWLTDQGQTHIDWVEP
ncbi:MAG: uracil-DNA glycosylase [Paracoccaceae bacterium]